MRLKRFSVKNFKNFQDKFTLDLADVRDYRFNKESIDNNIVKTGIIYGKNSVGKTNFGYAIFDIVYHLTEKMRLPEASLYYINADSDSTVADFEYTFANEGQEDVVYAYSKTSSEILVQESLKIGSELIYSYDYEKKEGNLENLLKIKELENLNLKLKDRNISVIRFIANNSELPNTHPIMLLYKFVNKMLWFRSIDGKNNFIGYNSLSESIFDYIYRNDYLSDLNKFLEDNGVEEKLVFQTTPDQQKLPYFDHKILLPYVTASSGTKALILFYYWYKHLNEASFVFVDEFDAFYHFELAEKILKLSMKLNLQILFTSHNTNLLSNKVMRPDCYFILTKTKIASFANLTKRELREGHNLEKLFISGEFNEE